FDKIIFAPISFNSSGLIVLTVANVPTGINIGVSKDPCGVCTLPSLAPVCLHVVIISYVIAGILCFILFWYNKHCFTKAIEKIFSFFCFFFCRKNYILTFLCIY